MRQLYTRYALLNVTQFRARTNRKKVAEILSQEIKKIKERYPYFELDIEQDAVRKPLLVKHEES